MQGEGHSTQALTYGHGGLAGYPRKPWWLSSQGCQTVAPIGANHHCTAEAMRERHTRQIATHNRVMEHLLGTGEVPIWHSV